MKKVAGFEKIFALLEDYGIASAARIAFNIVETLGLGMVFITAYADSPNVEAVKGQKKLQFVNAGGKIEMWDTGRNIRFVKQWETY